MGRVDSLVVDPAWRRRGIGKLLARSVEEWAVGLGAPWVELNVYDVNAKRSGSTKHWGTRRYPRSYVSPRQVLPNSA